MHAVLEFSPVEIPLYAAKLISSLSVLRRSNGDRFAFCVIGVTDFDTFIEHCRKTEEFLITLDFIVLFPTVGSRFQSNSPLYTKISAFFAKIYQCLTFDGVILVFLTELNWIVKSSNAINSMPASGLFDWVHKVHGDTKPYGWRSYFSFSSNVLAYTESVSFNLLNAFISITFCHKATVGYNGVITNIIGPSMHESICGIDTTSPEVLNTMLHYIVSSLNSVSTPRKPNVRPSASSSRVIGSKTDTSGKFSDNAALNGSPSRSYSTSLSKQKNNKYSCDVTVGDRSYSFNFPSYRELCNFYDSVKSS
jgi:hypothetical protein